MKTFLTYVLIDTIKQNDCMKFMGKDNIMQDYHYKTSIIIIPDKSLRLKPLGQYVLKLDYLQ